MKSNIRQLYPRSKLATNSARLARLERLLKTACNLLSQSETAVVIWPKDLINWYNKNVPDQPLTFEVAINELTDEQITALGLWAEDEDDDVA